MSTTWTSALDSYSYPVNLGDYKQAYEFPGFFGRTIAGARISTIDFFTPPFVLGSVPHYWRRSPKPGHYAT